MKWKELEDYDWFPPILRKYQMQNIGIQVELLGLYAQIVPLIGKILQQHKIQQITDLCSGSGFPAMYVHKRLTHRPLTTILTDKFPQPFVAAQGIHPEMLELDVLDFTPDSQTLYTMFNAFHHFEPQEQAALVQKIMDAKSALVVVEVLKPNLWNCLLVTLASTLGVWVFFWWIRPFEWRRFLFTYLLPINVLTVWLDGIISIFKSKSAKTYENSLKTQLSEKYHAFEVFEIACFPNPLTVLKITPFHA
jgi:hypothetical protein